MAETSSVQSSLNSALKTAAYVGKFALKKGVDLALTAATGGGSKLLQVGTKVIKGLGTLGSLKRKEEDKTLLWVLIGVGSFFFLVIVVIIITIEPFVLIKEAIGGAISPGYKVIHANKTVNPSKIENDKLNQQNKFTYDLVIGAKSTKLTNIKILKDEFTLIKKNGESEKIDLETNPTIDELNNSLDGVELEKEEITSLTFSIEIPTAKLPKEKLEDSLLINTLEVKGEILVGVRIKKVSSTTATITIGNPTGCFAFLGPWTDEEKSLELGAVAKLLSTSDKFTNNLCKNGSISLIREKKYDYCFARSKNSEIYILDKCLGTEANTLYSLAHEVGHIYAYRNPNDYAQFVAAIISFSGGRQLEPFLCSYPLVKSIDEDFPETISVYIMNWFYPDHLYPACGDKPINLQKDYPKHYNFIRTLFY